MVRQLLGSESAGSKNIEPASVAAIDQSPGAASPFNLMARSKELMRQVHTPAPRGRTSYAPPSQVLQDPMYITFKFMYSKSDSILVALLIAAMLPVTSLDVDVEPNNFLNDFAENVLQSCGMLMGALQSFACC